MPDAAEQAGDDEPDPHQGRVEADVRGEAAGDAPEDRSSWERSSGRRGPTSVSAVVFFFDGFFR